MATSFSAVVTIPNSDKQLTVAAGTELGPWRATAQKGTDPVITVLSDTPSVKIPNLAPGTYKVSVVRLAKKAKATDPDVELGETHTTTFEVKADVTITVATADGVSVEVIRVTA